MNDDKILDSNDLEYVAEMLRAIFVVRCELDVTSSQTLRELEEALPRAEALLRRVAAELSRSNIIPLDNKPYSTHRLG